MRFTQPSVGSLPWIILLSVAGLCGSRTGVAQIDREPLEAVLQAELDEIVGLEQAPGATLAVVLPDGKLVSLASGREERDGAEPMPAGARMLSGSVGKIFVSAVALQLVGEGRLELEDPVSRHLGGDAWFPRLPNAGDLTVRSLLNHTSGLQRYEFQPAFVAALKADPNREWTPQQCLEVLLDKEPLHPVGKGWSYSDTNYQLLGLVIEKVAAARWYDLLRERLLEPLQLRHTFPASQRRLPGLVQGHVGSENFFGLPAKTVAEGQYAINPQFEWCGGGLVTSVEDLARFAHALYGGDVLATEQLEELTSPVGFRDGQPGEQGYGLGAFVWQSSEGRFFGHAGVMPGYLTQVEYSERGRFAIALQFNHDEGMGRKHHQFAQRIAEVIRPFLQDPANVPKADPDAIRQSAHERELAAEPLYLAAVEAARGARNLDLPEDQSPVLDAIEKALKAGACPTRTLVEGTFLPLHCTPRYRALIRDHARQPEINMRLEGLEGSPLRVQGVIRDEDGQPVAGALVHVFHTDGEGYYSPGGMDEDNPRIFGYLRTDEAGRYAFSTIRPGHYAGQTEVDQHIHFEIKAPGFREQMARLVFADDPVWERFSRPAWAVPVSVDDQGVAHCNFDIQLEHEPSRGG